MLSPEKTKPVNSPSPIIYIDRLWRSQSVLPLRLYSKGKDGLGPLRPGRAAPACIVSIPNQELLAPLEIAEENDLDLWASSSSVEDYENRKAAILADQLRAREEFMICSGTFPQFQDLPIELRLRIWELATEEPVDVKVAPLNGISFFRSRLACGALAARPDAFRLLAMLPPLFLVNHEANAVANSRYKRRFLRKELGIPIASSSNLTCTNSMLLTSFTKKCAVDFEFIERLSYKYPGDYMFITTMLIFFKMHALRELEILIRCSIHDKQGPNQNIARVSSSRMFKSMVEYRKRSLENFRENATWKAPRTKFVTYCEAMTSEEHAVYLFPGGGKTVVEGWKKITDDILA